MTASVTAPAKLRLVDCLTTNIFLPQDIDARQLNFTLSPLDTWFSVVGYTVGCFAYPNSLDVPKVQAGVASALRAFPGFAGRLRCDDVRSKLYVTCSEDAYLPFTVATSALTLTDFVPATKPLPADGHSCFMYRLADISALYQGLPTKPSELCNQDMPLARATLVQLADGATLLALTMSHMLGDQKSAALFMSAWAAGNRGLSPGQPGIFGRDAWDQLAQLGSPLADNYDSPYFQLLPPEQRPLPAAIQQLETVFQSLPSVMLVVTRERLQQLKQQANKQLQQLKQKVPDVYADVDWLSTYDVAVGRMSQILSSLPSRQGKPLTVRNLISLRGRAKLPDGSPAVSPQQVGNYVLKNCITFESHEQQDTGGNGLLLTYLAAATRRETYKTAARAPQELAFWNKHEAAGPGEHLGIIYRRNGPPPADLYLQGDVTFTQWSWDANALTVATVAVAGDNNLLSKPVHCQGCVGLVGGPTVYILPAMLLGGGSEDRGGGLCLQLAMSEEAVQQLMALGPNFF